MSWLTHPTVLAIRRNHALEHATVHLLSQKKPGVRVVGHSNPGGFVLIGNITLDEVQSTADEALARLRAGQKHLAIHPGCGTNLVLNLLGAGAGAWLGMAGTRNDRERFDRIPFAGLLAVLALSITVPLGPKLQEKVTTEADLGNLEIQTVQIVHDKPPYIYFVRTA